MSPSLLAGLRAAATRHMSGHDYSDLMEYGVFLLYSAAINMQSGITVKFVDAIERTSVGKVNKLALRQKHA